MTACNVEIGQVLIGWVQQWPFRTHNLKYWSFRKVSRYKVLLKHYGSASLLTAIWRAWNIVEDVEARLLQEQEIYLHFSIPKYSSLFETSPTLTVSQTNSTKSAAKQPAGSKLHPSARVYIPYPAAWADKGQLHRGGKNLTGSYLTHTTEKEEMQELKNAPRAYSLHKGHQTCLQPAVATTSAQLKQQPRALTTRVGAACGLPRQSCAQQSCRPLPN